MHTAREIRLRSLDDEMVMIRHQDPRSERPSKPSNRLAEEDEEGLAIAIGAEDGTVLIAAGGEVVESACEFKS